MAADILLLLLLTTFFWWHLSNRRASVSTHVRTHVKLSGFTLAHFGSSLVSAEISGAKKKKINDCNFIQTRSQSQIPLDVTLRRQ